MTGGAADYYRGQTGEAYYEQRQALRSDKTQATRTKHFSGFTSGTDTILDFGCGTGGVVSRLPAARRIGIEIGPGAAEAATRLDAVFDNLAKVETASVDRVISYHALEHVENPVDVIREMKRVLKPGGKVKIIVPCDNAIFSKRHRNWFDNPEMHLSSWTPLTLGNLLTVGGFKVSNSGISAGSEGGKIASIFPRNSLPWKLIVQFKALRSGRFHTFAEASA